MEEAASAVGTKCAADWVQAKRGLGDALAHKNVEFRSFELLNDKTNLEKPTLCEFSPVFVARWMGVRLTGAGFCYSAQSAPQLPTTPL